jgi:hypothetical protein
MFESGVDSWEGAVLMHGLRNSFVLIFFILSALSGACVHEQKGRDSGPASLHGDPYVQTTLVFGLAKPGGAVTEAEWQYFVDSYVTPRYRQGLTIIDTDGQWMMRTGEVIKEDSMIIILLYDTKSQAENDKNIEFITDTYKKLFQQEAVLRIDTAAGVSF